MIEKDPPKEKATVKEREGEKPREKKNHKEVTEIKLPAPILAEKPIQKKTRGHLHICHFLHSLESQRS